MVSDHLQPWRHVGGHAPNALACLTAIGERTERVVLGTSVLTPSFRYNPAVLAQQFATLALLNPDRVVLGVGTGEALNEMSVGLAEWPEFKERFARLREAVRLMRALWADERVSFDGDYYRTDDATIYDRPEGGVPIYVAAGGPVMAKYAGRVADGFICTSGKGMDLYTDKLLPAVVDGLSTAQRPVDAIARMIEIKLSYAPTRDEALENTRFWAPLSALGRRQAPPRRPARDGLRRRQAAHRGGRQALDRGDHSRGRRRRRPAVRRGRLRPPRPARARPRPGGLPDVVRP